MELDALELDSMEIDSMEILIMAFIGSGTYGSVFKHTDGTVRKSISHAKEVEGAIGNYQSTIREIIAYKVLLGVPNIAVLHKIKSNPEKTNIILTHYKQPLSDMTLPLPLEQVKSFTFQILNAVSYMHNCGLMHRDIKPNNIMVTGDQIYLIDFGLSRYCCYSSDKAYSEEAQSLHYMAPEVMLTQLRHKIEPYTSKIDIWSIGIIVLNMLGKFNDIYPISRNDMIRHIIHQYGPINVDRWNSDELSDLNSSSSASASAGATNIIDTLDIPEQLKSLLHALLIYDPMLRISATHAIGHPYFNELPRITQPSYTPATMHYPNSQLTGRSRTVLLSWIFEVASRFSLIDTTLYHSYVLLDHYYTTHPVEKNLLQITGCVMLYISTLIYEMYPPDPMDMVYIADEAFTFTEFMKEYCRILDTMDYNIFVPYKVVPAMLHKAAILTSVKSPTVCLEQIMSDHSLIDMYDDYKFTRKCYNKVTEWLKSESESELKENDT